MIKHTVARYKSRSRFYVNGVILIFALWIMFLLSLFALYLGYGARQKAIIVKRLGQRDSTRLIAEAGVKKAIFEINRDNDTGVDSFSDYWALNDADFKDIKVGKGRFNVFYNHSEGGKINKIFGIVDEARKVNINKAGITTLQRLFEVVLDMNNYDAKALAASIVDFRDADSTLSIPQGSAEDSYYKHLSEPYDCKDANFESLDEVLLVRGMNKNIFDKIKGFITVYGDSKMVNINTASGEVLYAVGIGKGLVDKIISYREGEDKEIATLDDNIFNSPGSVVAQLSRYYSLSADEVANLSNVVAAGFIGVSSSYFSISSYAKLDYSAVTENINCIVDRGGNILFWRER